MNYKVCIADNHGLPFSDYTGNFHNHAFLDDKRPHGIRLGLAAGIGAAASLLVGTVTLNDAAVAFVDIWDAALAFIRIVTLSVTLDAMGFFKWAAIKWLNWLVEAA